MKLLAAIALLITLSASHADAGRRSQRRCCCASTGTKATTDEQFVRAWVTKHGGVISYERFKPDFFDHESVTFIELEPPNGQLFIDRNAFYTIPWAALAQRAEPKSEAFAKLRQQLELFTLITKEEVELHKRLNDLKQGWNNLIRQFQ